MTRAVVQDDNVVVIRDHHLALNDLLYSRQRVCYALHQGRKWDGVYWTPPEIF